MSIPDKLNRSNIAGLLAVILFLGTFIYLSVVLAKVRRMKEDSRNEKLQTEILLSEKLMALKRAAQLQSEVGRLESRCHATTEKLSTIQAILTETETRVSRGSGCTQLITALRNEICRGNSAADSCPVVATDFE